MCKATLSRLDTPTWLLRVSKISAHVLVLQHFVSSVTSLHPMFWLTFGDERLLAFTYIHTKVSSTHTAYGDMQYTLPAWKRQQVVVLQDITWVSWHAHMSTSMIDDTSMCNNIILYYMMIWVNIVRIQLDLMMLWHTTSEKHWVMGLHKRDWARYVILLVL